VRQLFCWRLETFPYSALVYYAFCSGGYCVTCDIAFQFQLCETVAVCMYSLRCFRQPGDAYWLYDGVALIMWLLRWRARQAGTPHAGDLALFMRLLPRCDVVETYAFTMICRYVPLPLRLRRYRYRKRRCFDGISPLTFNSGVSSSDVMMRYSGRFLMASSGDKAS